jgi:hypothetical protein
MSAVFSKQLEIGQLGESVIARWCMSRGNSVIPVYEKEIITGKGPRFFSPQGQFVAPDMFILPSMTFIEAKHKTVFSWHRITGRWCTGIDLNHYEDYQKVQAITGRPVWLLFLHRCSIPDKRDLVAGCPAECPVGLFGNDLKFLSENENHRHKNHGRHGMVYWAVDKLRLMSPLNEILENKTISDLFHYSDD